MPGGSGRFTKITQIIMAYRVVISGLGIVSPNGIGLPAFKNAIKKGESGVVHFKELEDLQFDCQIGSMPSLTESTISQYFTQLELRKFNNSGIIYGVIAGMDAWRDARMPIEPTITPDWDTGAIFGSGTISVDKLRESVYQVDKLQTRKLGSNNVIQTMPSGITAYLGGKLGLGNQVTINSSACATGTESILMAYDRIKYGKAKRMLAGGTNDSGPYVWAGFDAMKVTTYKFNDAPQKGSRPMSASASGFVPGSGAGALLLESLESALERGAHIYAEILGGHINSGGQRGDGSMTLPNSVAVQRCISEAMKEAGIVPEEIDAINGHLTSTGKCSLEIKNWASAIKRKGKDFPYITALKSMIGHTLGAAGAIESIAAILQLQEGFLVPNLNTEDLDPVIENLVDREKIPQQLIYKDLNIIAKSSFGFGDVNACVIFKKYQA